MLGYRIRTYDFHRVNLEASWRKVRIYRRTRAHIGSTGNEYLGNYGPMANLRYHLVSYRGVSYAASRSSFVHCVADR